MSGLPAPIGALPAVPSAAVGQPSGTTNFFGALAGAPDEARRQQLARLQSEAERQKIGQQLLSTIGTRLATDPNAAQNSGLAQQADQITRESGLPSVTRAGASGEELNPEAFPGRDLNDLPAEKHDFFFSLPAESKPGYLRSIGIDPRRIDASILKLGPTYPLGSPQRTALLNEFSKQMQTVADPKGAGPEGFLSWVKANGQNLSAIGVDTSTLTNNPELLDSLGKRALAETEHLAATGAIKIEEMQRYHDGLLQHYRDQLDERKKTDASTIQKNSEQIARWHIQNKQTLETIKEMPQKLEIARMRLASIGAKNAQLTNAKALLALANSSKGQLSSARSSLTALEGLRQKYTSAYQPVPTEVQSQIETLQAQVDELTPAVTAAESEASTAIKQSVSGALGATVTGTNLGTGGTAPPPLGPPVAHDPKNREVFFSGGQYVYSDRTPYKP